MNVAIWCGAIKYTAINKHVRITSCTEKLYIIPEIYIKIKYKTCLPCLCETKRQPAHIWKMKWYITLNIENEKHLSEKDKLYDLLH